MNLAILFTLAWLSSVYCQKDPAAVTIAAEDVRAAVKGEVPEQTVPWPWPPKDPCFGIICLNPCYVCAVKNGFPVCIPKIKCPPCFSMAPCNGECYCKPDCRATSGDTKCACPNCKVCSPVTGTCVPKICPLCQHCNPATGNCTYTYDTVSGPAAEFIARIAQLPEVEIEQGTFTAPPIICPLAAPLPPLPCSSGCCLHWGAYYKNGQWHFSCIECCPSTL